MKKIILFLFLSLIFNTQLPTIADNIEEATTLYNEAIDMYSADEIDKSIELFSRAIELNPDFYEAHYNLAQVLMSVDKNEQALKSLEEIIKLKPNDSETLYNLGKIQYKRGYLSKAHGYLEQIKETAPQYDSAKILIEKIEKRQKELNLESKINSSKPSFDAQGKAQSSDLGEFEAPSGIAIDKRGNIYVASFSQNTIYKISIYGQKSVFNRSNLLRGPIGIAIDKENNLYSANYSANTITKITPEGAVSVFATVEKPYCITYDEVHNRLYVTEQNSNKLVKFDL